MKRQRRGTVAWDPEVEAVLQRASTAADEALNWSLTPARRLHASLSHPGYACVVQGVASAAHGIARDMRAWTAQQAKAGDTAAAARNATATQLTAYQMLLESALQTVGVGDVEGVWDCARALLAACEADACEGGGYVALACEGDVGSVTDAASRLWKGVCAVLTGGEAGYIGGEWDYHNTLRVCLTDDEGEAVDDVSEGNVCVQLEGGDVVAVACAASGVVEVGYRVAPDREAAIVAHVRVLGKPLPSSPLTIQVRWGRSAGRGTCSPGMLHVSPPPPPAACPAVGQRHPVWPAPSSSLSLPHLPLILAALLLLLSPLLCH